MSRCLGRGSSFGKRGIRKSKCVLCGQEMPKYALYFLMLLFGSFKIIV